MQKYGRTALHFAAESGCVDIVPLLVERGADVNALNVSNLRVALLSLLLVNDSLRPHRVFVTLG